MSTCRCKWIGVFRYTWPGRNESRACPYHANQIVNVAAAMSSNIQMIPIDLGPESTPCDSMLSESKLPKIEEFNLNTLKESLGNAAKNQTGGANLNCPKCGSFASFVALSPESYMFQCTTDNCIDIAEGSFAEMFDGEGVAMTKPPSHPGPELFGYECHFYDFQSNDEIPLIDFNMSVDIPYLNIRHMPPIIQAKQWGRDENGGLLLEDGLPVTVWRYYYLVSLEVDDAGKEYKFIISPAPPPEPINIEEGK